MLWRALVIAKDASRQRWSPDSGQGSYGGMYICLSSSSDAVRFGTPSSNLHFGVLVDCSVVSGTVVISILFLLLLPTYL